MKLIVVRTSFEGIHCYPDAPQTVSYLKHPHRHLFKVEAKIGVNHNDRELEFICVKHKIDNDYIRPKLDDNGVWQMGRLSCEQVADDLVEFLTKEYGNLFIRDRYFSVEVSEDGENGAIVNNEVVH